MLLFGTAFYCMDIRDTSSKLPLMSIALAMAGFILQTISTSINQQKVVNLEKEIEALFVRYDKSRIEEEKEESEETKRKEDG